VSPSATSNATRPGQERAHVERVLAERGEDQAEAARLLGIGRTTLYRSSGACADG